MTEILYATLILDKIKRPINQENIVAILNAADAEFEIESVIKVVDSINGDTVKEFIRKGTIKTIMKELRSEVMTMEELEKELEDEEEPTGLLKLSG